MPPMACAMILWIFTWEQTAGSASPVGTGFDAVPLVSRRPIVHVNIVPLGYLPTFRERPISITKRHSPVLKKIES